MCKVLVKSYEFFRIYGFTVSCDIKGTLHTLVDANNGFMCSLDITSLYTNIPIAETIAFILNNIHTTGVSIYEDISLENFRKLLQLTLNNTYFKFNETILKHIKYYST